MINEVIMAGRLTKDVEIKTLDNGDRVANITLAVPRNYKDEQGNTVTDFVDVSVWNAQADSLAKYKGKGEMICVKGSLNTSIRETEEGKSIKTCNVRASNVKFLDSKAKENKEER